MLVFSRKIGEGIVLPNCGVMVTVTRVAGKRVRLSIVAPPHVQVHRTEVLGRIQREISHPQTTGREEDRHDEETPPFFA